jgi:hypothetical protein
VEPALSLSDPDGDRGERLRDREDVSPVIGDPTMRQLDRTVERDVQTFETEMLIGGGLPKAHRGSVQPIHP